jgi:hypothetical protein
MVYNSTERFLQLYRAVSWLQDNRTRLNHRGCGVRMHLQGCGWEKASMTVSAEVGLINFPQAGIVEEHAAAKGQTA